MPPKIGSSTAPVGDHFPATGNAGKYGSTSSEPVPARAGLRGNEALRGALAQRTGAGAEHASGGTAGLRRTNSMSRLADFSRAALERQMSLPTTSRERLQAGSLLATRDTERPAETNDASDERPAKPTLKPSGSTPKPVPQKDAQSAPASHASTPAPAAAPAPAYGYPAHSPYWSAPTYRTHQFGAHRPIGFSYGHGTDAFGGTHGHVGFHYFGRQHTLRFSVSDSMSAFLKGFRSGFLNPVVYHAPPPMSYPSYGSYVPPYVGHHFHPGGYVGHHPYAIGYPAAPVIGYPVGARR